MRINKIIFLTIYVISMILGCSPKGQNSEERSQQLNGKKNLNVTILIDLSDRISVKKNPFQVQNDLKLIGHVLEYFKNYMAEKGVVNSEDKIKVIYYPEIENDTMSSIFDSLNIDFSKLSFIDRKRTFSILTQRFENNLKKVYEIASKSSIYPGSDLFNYFKHRIVDDCIINDENYINILLILTDGYIYHINAKYQQGTRFSYLTPKSQHIQLFRNKSNWEEIFEKKDYGLINTGLDLSSLTIIAAQFDPIASSPKDFDILKKYWSKWFEEQNVKPTNYKILRNDNPNLNIRVIESFLTKVVEN